MRTEFIYGLIAGGIVVGIISHFIIKYIKLGVADILKLVQAQKIYDKCYTEYVQLVDQQHYAHLLLLADNLDKYVPEKERTLLIEESNRILGLYAVKRAELEQKLKSILNSTNKN